jgi:hydroxyacylglutathione hydrolase
MTIKVTSACLGSLGTNAYLVETGKHVILVDPAVDGPALRELVGDRRVDFVVDTHGHYDHVGGNWAIPSGAVCIHEADAGLVAMFFPQHPPFQRLLRDGEDFVDGIRVLHAPGHSPGSVVLVADGALLTGDFPGGSEDEMEASLRKILALSGERVVYPGHGEATTLERERRRNPFLRGLS